MTEDEKASLRWKMTVITHDPSKSAAWQELRRYYEMQALKLRNPWDSLKILASKVGCKGDIMVLVELQSDNPLADRTPYWTYLPK